METTFDSRIIKVEHRMIFERISNTSGQCVFRTTTLDRSPSNNPRSLRESISRFRDTRVPITASPPLLPLINRHDWNSRYLSSNNWTNFHFWNSGPDNTTWNWRSREIFTRYCCFTDDDFKSRRKYKKIYHVALSLYFRRITSLHISTMIYAQFRGRNFGVENLHTRGE